MLSSTTFLVCSAFVLFSALHNLRLRRLPPASLWLAVAFLSLIRASGPAYSQETAYEVRWTNPVELKVRGWDSLGYDASYVSRPGDQKLRKLNARFETGFGPLDSEIRFKAYYPVCSAGDIIPMFGTTCRVGPVPPNSKVQDSGIDENGPNPGRVKLTAIKASDPKVVVIPDCLTIPNKGAVIRLDMAFDREWHHPSYRLDVESIFEREGKPVARIKMRVLNFRGVKREAETSETSMLELSVGERLQIPPSYRLFGDEKEVMREKEIYLVKHLVLPDDDNKIIGWGSFEPLLVKWAKPLKPGERQ